MPGVVIDAQIVNAYYVEEVIQDTSKLNLTASASKLINRLGHSDKVFLDEEGHIETEWRQVVAPEWLDAWLADLLQKDAARLLSVVKKGDPGIKNWLKRVKKQLEQVGFPTTGHEGRDLWYIRTAKAVVDDPSAPNCCYIISEDIHFHHPEQKEKAKGEERLKYLEDLNSPVKKVLSPEKIFVHCLASYLNLEEFCDD